MSKHVKFLIFTVIVLIVAIASYFIYSPSSSRVEIVNESVIDASVNPHQSQVFNYFDDANQLQLGFEKTDAIKNMLAQVCTPDTLVANPYFRNLYNQSDINAFNNYSYKVLLQSPRVVSLYCDQSHQHGYFLGVNSEGVVQWKYPIETAFSPNVFNMLMIAGASQKGIIIQESQYNKGKIKYGLFFVVSPQTGQILYPLDNQSKMNKNELVQAVYDSSNQVIYMITFASNALYKFDTHTGMLSQLNILPRKLLALYSFYPLSLNMTLDGKYLVTVVGGPAIFSPNDVFMIYDLSKNEWIYTKSLPQSAIGVPQVALSKGNNIGLLWKDNDGYHLIHFRIKDTNT